MHNVRGVLCLLLVLSLHFPLLAAGEGRKPASKSAAKALRVEWELGELKLTREAVDDTSFKPAVKSRAVEALEKFIAGQEQLISRVEQAPDAEAGARRQRARLHADFMQRMAVINDDPQLRRELAASVKALNREMDEMADSAARLFSRLEQVDLTPAQKEKLKPVVEDASRKVRSAVEKSRSRSTRDRDNREEVVEKFKESRRKVKQHLTPQQREKLRQKLAESQPA